MCFSEFLAYTCGHTSIAINRPCPLTTQIYTNPCCPRPACRPFLAPSMCYPCARILHGRRLDIAEFEHQWMHFRGACNCEVVFPVLQGPRLTRRLSAGLDEREEAEALAAMVGTNAPVTNPIQPRRREHKNRRTVSSNTSRQRADTDLPLFSEAQVGKHVEVAVRMNSLYGAEWTKDHAELHRRNRCQCPVSFERYQPIDTSDCYEDEFTSPQAPPRSSPLYQIPEAHSIQASANQPPFFAPHSSPAGESSSSSSGSRSIAAAATTTATATATPTAQTSRLNPQASTFTADGVPAGTQVPYNPLQSDYRVPVGQMARTTLDDGFSQSVALPIPPPPPRPQVHNDSLLDKILGPVVNPNTTTTTSASASSRRPQTQSQNQNYRGIDMQTTHYALDDTPPLAGHPLSLSFPVGGRSCSCSSSSSPFPSSSAIEENGNEKEEELSSIVQFAPPASNVAGLPIGAGPEGDSHAGDFASCELRASLLPRGGGGRRRRSSTDF